MSTLQWSWAATLEALISGDVARVPFFDVMSALSLVASAFKLLFHQSYAGHSTGIPVNKITDFELEAIVSTRALCMSAIDELALHFDHNLSHELVEAFVAFFGSNMLVCFPGNFGIGACLAYLLENLCVIDLMFCSESIQSSAASEIGQVSKRLCVSFSDANQCNVIGLFLVSRRLWPAILRSVGGGDFYTLSLFVV